MPASRGGDDIWSDPAVRGFLEEVVGAIKRVSASSSEMRTLMDAAIATRPHHHELHPDKVWHGIVSNSKRVIEGEYLLLRQGLGREGRNRLDVSWVDGVLTVSGDRIADAFGLAIGTPNDRGEMCWTTVSLSHVSDRVWPLDPSALDEELVTFATFTETEITSAWQGSIAPSDHRFASAS